MVDPNNTDVTCIQLKQCRFYLNDACIKFLAIHNPAEVMADLDSQLNSVEIDLKVYTTNS